MTTVFGVLALLLHPAHETVAEIEWNSQTSRLEVALRLSVLDEQWIGRQAKIQGDIKDWATKYLASRFQIDPPADHQANDRSNQYHWVGREQQGSHVWWYFEIEPCDQARPRVVAQRMLTERGEGYVNRVIVLGQQTRRAVTLTAAKPQAKLEFDPAENN